MNLSGLDLNLLKAFDAMMSERHVTRAGQRIGLTQSAMSGALSRLRHLFADELFVRTPLEMRPTPRALDLAEPITAALKLIAGIVSSVDAFDAGAAQQRFIIALTDYSAAVVLPPLITRLQSIAPGIDIEVRGMFDRDETLTLLDNGDATLAIGFPPKPSPQIRTETLFQESFVCITRKNHPAFENGLSFEAFVNAHHVLISPDKDQASLIDSRLAQLGYNRRVTLCFPHFLVAARVVASTDLVATIASRIARYLTQDQGGIETHAAPMALDGFPIAMMWHRRTDAHPGNAWLRQIARDVTLQV